MPRLRRPAGLDGREALRPLPGRLTVGFDILAEPAMPGTNPEPDAAVHPRLRVLRGEEIALGPGKVALLEAIAARGTLARAAEDLRMSYMRAWKLVQTMNRCFRQPLVETARGGSTKGRATLTGEGEAVVALYRRMEAEGLAAMRDTWRQLARRLAPPPMG